MRGVKKSPTGRLRSLSSGAALLLLPLLLLGWRPVSDRWYAAEAAVGLSLGPVLGSPTDRGLTVWGRGAGDGAFQVEVRRPGASWAGQVSPSAPFEADRDYTAVVTLDGLTPATSYDYRVLVNGQPLPDGGSFRTLPESSAPTAFRFAVGGDLSAQNAPFSILNRVVDWQPDFCLLTGDLVYADHPELIPASVDAYLGKYRANWADAGFRGLARRVPAFAIWDDHEIVNDYDGREAGRYRPARRAFESYVRAQLPRPRQAGQLYYSFNVGDVEFFVLDTRSHRSPNGMPDGPAKSMLGQQQRADLLAWLTTSRAPFKVIVSSVPFHDLGRRRIDAWSSYATERAELLGTIQERGIGGVVILSGDQHWSSLVRHDPYGIWEFNATPLAQSVDTASLPNDPRLVLGYNSSPAFGIVDVDTRGAVPTMTFSVVDPSGTVRASQTIEAAPGLGRAAQHAR